MSRLPANQKHRPYGKRWKRYEKLAPAIPHHRPLLPQRTVVLEMRRCAGSSTVHSPRRVNHDYSPPVSHSRGDTIKQSIVCSAPRRSLSSSAIDELRGLRPRQQKHMSITRGIRPDHGPHTAISMQPEPLDEFLAEESVSVGPAPTSSELELFTSEDVGGLVSGAAHRRPLASLLLSAAAITAIAAAGVTGLMRLDGTRPAEEPVAETAVSAAISPVPPAEVPPHRTWTEVLMIEQVTSASPRVDAIKRTQVDAIKRHNAGSNGVTRSRVRAAADATAVSIHPGQRDSDVTSTSAAVPIESEPLLLATELGDPMMTHPGMAAAATPVQVRVTATAFDPDGDGLWYRWSAPIGQFADATEPETFYTCPAAATTVALTVTVSDGRGGVASDILTIRCIDQP